MRDMDVECRLPLRSPARRKRTIRVMSDDEAHQWFQDARVRQMTPCSLCNCTAYTADAPCARPGDTLLHLSSCNDQDHGVCPSCVSAIASAHVAKEGGQAAAHVPCPYPFDGRCDGRMRIPKAQLESLKSRFLRHDFRVPATCPHCRTCAAYCPTETYAHQCSHCSASFCVRCESAQCICGTATAVAADWSRYVRESGMPLRNRDVHATHVSALVQAADEAGVGGHVRCPSCGMRLYKDSACNELTHCSGTAACYACGASAHPWERALPSTHWDTCPRWDHEDAEARAAGFVCREGDCYGAHGECSVAEHAAGRLAYHVVRRKRFEAAFLIF